MSLLRIDVIKMYQQKSALVIDDFPDMRGSIRRMLINMGIASCDTACNGEEAMAKCEEHDYDIILADFNLGRSKDGQQILEELRFKNLLKNTAIYMMITAETTKKMVFSVLEYQPDEYLSKPFTQGVLQKRLDRLLFEKNALYDVNSAMDQFDYPRAISSCKKKIDDSDKYKQRCYRIMANCFYQDGQYAEARQVYESILAVRSLEWARIGLGKTLMSMDKLDEAEDLFTELTKEGCLCMEVYDCLAEIRSQRGDVAAAQQTLEQAIEISPNSIIRQKKLAEFCEENRDWGQAEKARRKVVKLAHNSVYEHPEHHFDLARCINTAIAEDPEKNHIRQQRVEEVLQKTKKKYSAYQNMALQVDAIRANTYALVNEDDNRDRLALLEKLLKKADNASPELMMDMARVYQVKNERATASRILSELMDIYEDDTDIASAIDRLADDPLSSQGKRKAAEFNEEGKEHFSGKQFHDAIKLYKQALRQFPNNIGLNLNLMLALVRDMNANGASASQLEQCQYARDKISHIEEDNPFYERYTVLCQHLEKLQGTI